MTNKKRGKGKLPSKDFLNKTKAYRDLILSTGGGTSPAFRYTLEEDISKYIFEEGIYVIGELGEFEIDYTNTDKVEDDFGGYWCDNNGVYKAKRGSLFANIRTCWGDGIYIDNNLREYIVDTGSIGCISAKEVILGDYTTVALFPKPFTVNYDRETGIIRFGNLFIDTDFIEMGKREIYFYDPSNTYEASHPSNKNKEYIDIKITEYHKVKHLYPKPKEKIIFSLIKYIKNNENSKNDYEFKKPASKGLIINFFEKIKSFENKNESKSRKELINYLENSKYNIKEWILNLKRESLKTKESNGNNIDLYGNKAKPIKIFFDENNFLQNVDIKKFERIINNSINYLKHKK